MIKNKYLRKVSVVFLCIISAIIPSGCVDQNIESRNSGNQIDGSRIIATSVAVCNILDALDVDSVVGVPETSSYSIPDRYSNASLIGSPMNPDSEILRSLNPTLILSPDSLEGDLAPKYKAVGSDSAFLNLSSVNGMYKSIQDLGVLLGKEDKSEELVNDYLSFMDQYTTSNIDKKAPTVLLLMGLPGSYVVATSSSYVGSLLEMAGAVNVYGDGDGQAFLNINTEDMLEKKPEIILRTAHAMPEQVMQMFDDEFKNNDIWKHFDAVNKGRVYNLDSHKFGMSAGFNYKDALNDLQEILYHEAE